jgi:hypothetical protein
VKRTALVVIVAATVFALRAIPAAPARPPARAGGGACSLPVISTVCSVVSGLTDGVSWTVDSTTGLVKDAAGKVIAKVADKLGYACVCNDRRGHDGRNRDASGQRLLQRSGGQTDLSSG